MVKIIMTNPEEQVSGSEKMNADSDQTNKDEQQMKRSCVDCHTTRTPLWRGGPAGPRSLCNACGIRYRKQRSALLGMGEKNKKKNTDKIVSVKLRLMGLGRDMMLQTRLERSGTQKKMKLGEEEEEAAMLLMALSSGSVYAS